MRVWCIVKCAAIDVKSEAHWLAHTLHYITNIVVHTLAADARNSNRERRARLKTCLLVSCLFSYSLVFSCVTCTEASAAFLAFELRTIYNMRVAPTLEYLCAFFNGVFSCEQLWSL